MTVAPRPIPNIRSGMSDEEADKLVAQVAVRIRFLVDQNVDRISEKGFVKELLKMATAETGWSHFSLLVPLDKVASELRLRYDRVNYTFKPKY